MRSVERAIGVSDGVHVSSVWAVPGAYDRERALVLGHGAGNDMHSDFVSYVHAEVAGRGALAVKFNFPYTERGARAPDRPAVLQQTWRAVAAAVRDDPDLAPRRLVLGGKSMGGRIASVVAADGEPCAGLVFLGYPLHPAGQPDKLRVDHLRDIGLLERTLATLAAPVTLHRIEEGDHSFAVPKRAGRAPAEIYAEIVDVVARWIAALD
jgi:predicted alpha/beta-hydrolase family hydrolase